MNRSTLLARAYQHGHDVAKMNPQAQLPLVVSRAWRWMPEKMLDAFRELDDDTDTLVGSINDALWSGAKKARSEPENPMYRCTECGGLFLLHSIADSGRCKVCIDGEKKQKDLELETENERLRHEVEALRKQVES